MAQSVLQLFRRVTVQMKGLGREAIMVSSLPAGAWYVKTRKSADITSSFKPAAIGLEMARVHFLGSCSFHQNCGKSTVLHGFAEVLVVLSSTVRAGAGGFASFRFGRLTPTSLLILPTPPPPPQPVHLPKNPKKRT